MLELAYLTELSNRGCAVASLNQIQAFSQRVVDQFQPEKVILFGSYAYGQPTEDSDVDLLVIRQFKFEVQQRLIYPRRILQRVFCSQVIFSA
jgi:predicted nucleotidyltransferase